MISISFSTILLFLHASYAFIPAHISRCNPYSSILSMKSSTEKLRIPATDSVGIYVEVARAATKSALPPILFVHGSYHGAWCWSEAYTPFFTANGFDCYAISLRGTNDTGMPKGSTSKSVMITEHMSDVSQVLDSIIVSEKKSQVIVVSHSFGGVIVQKLLEDKDTRAKLKAAVLMCSVPPSGNGPMTGRFVKKNLWNALKIVYGFVLKKAASNKSISRELFFGDITAVSDEKLDEYMERFKRDSVIGLDLTTLGPLLPSKSADDSGRATWLSTTTGSEAPPRLVLGAEKDFIVDAEGVCETAAYLGVEPVIIPGAYHDVMLGSMAKTTSRVIFEWIQKIACKAK